MSDTVFRTQSDVKPTPQQEESLPKGQTPDATPIQDNIEVPYLDYETQNNHPYSVDYFKLGSTWDEPVGGFPHEIANIEDYVKEKVNRGEIANSVKAITNYFKELEKITNIKNEERAVIKVETLSNYIEFLRKTDGLKRSLVRYGSS